MIVVDTNVISEPLWGSPEANLIERIDALLRQTLFLPVMTDSELRAGVTLMPVGKRRTTLSAAWCILPLSVLPCEQKLIKLFGVLKS
jgi:toxin FitB